MRRGGWRRRAHHGTCGHGTLHWIIPDKTVETSERVM
jgi:hypothetical protein